MATDRWVWHRSRPEGRVHAYPPALPSAVPTPLDAAVSLCARVVTYPDAPIPTEHDPIDRCGLCVRRDQEAAR